jgi:hypothetical protein
VIPGDQSIPVNLSPPDRANARHSSAWLSDSTLTQKLSAARIRGQLVDAFDGAMAISGGSSDSETKLWQVKPTGCEPWIAVTTVTPVAKCPITSRSAPASGVMVSPPPGRRRGNG